MKIWFYILLLLIFSGLAFYIGYMLGNKENRQVKDDIYDREKALKDSLIREQEQALLLMKDSLNRLNTVLDSTTLISKEYAEKIARMRSNPARLPSSTLQSELERAGERLSKGGY